MRRIVCLLVVSILVVFTSCQKEPINSDSLFTIDMEAMYTELDLMDEIRIQLNLGSGVIVDSILIYDESGRLYTRSGVESSNISTVSLNLSDLKNGYYTAVTYQYFKSKDGPTIWFTTDIRELSSLSIQHSKKNIDGIYALGVTTDIIEVQNGFCEVQIEPKAAGSIIDFQLDNYSNLPNDGINDNLQLPPVDLYLSNSCLGLYPGRNDISRWMIQSYSSAIIGSLYEGQSHKKLFTLVNGNNINIVVNSILSPNFTYIYYQDIISLYPGSNMVCYYNFKPKSFYYYYCGTPEYTTVFKSKNIERNCTLYPYIQWGASKTDVEEFLNRRIYEPCKKGKLTVTEEGTYIEYNPLPELSEVYIFDSSETLSEVMFSYEGGDVFRSVITSMEKEGYTFLGYIFYYVYVVYFYISPDKKTEFVIFGNKDLPPTFIGYSSWYAFFYPVNQDDLDMLGITL